ncbi:MAG TPA: SDR family NAD(P)-dependent oxidoreductase [Blastocatellia bacterium]|nr:SDR family NAD(P)-dependent oxidoreductase [Blastocatellia bacterium]
MKTILVTGGAGFIGSHLVDRLLATTAARVVVVDNFSDFYAPEIKRTNVCEHLQNPRYQLIEADIREWEQLRSVFSANTFDAIVHLAACTGVRPSLEHAVEYEQTNVTGTVHLLELARKYGIRKFVFGSSSSVYGANPNAPFKEEFLPLPISPYAATKAAGEMFAYTYSHLYQIQTVCLRFFTVYGPRQRPDLAIHKFARLMSEGKPIPLYGDGTTERDYTYVGDIVSGIVAALHYDQTPFEAINLGCSETVPLKRVVALLESSLGVQANMDRLPMHPGDLERTHADIRKAERLLGYAPTTTIEAGIQKFVEWFRQVA